MTRQEIDAVLERVKTWPEDWRASLAEIVLTIEKQDRGVYHLSDEELAGIEQGIAEANRGEFASDQEMAALFDRYRL